MRLFVSTLVLAAILPVTVNAEVTLESFQALRAEALTFQSSANATPEGQTKARLQQSVSSALSAVYPEDFAAHALTDAYRGRAACLDGNQDACMSVADLYRDGEHVWKDVELASELYWLGCQEGHGPACDRFDEIRDVSVAARDLPYPNRTYHVEACDADVAVSCNAIYRDMYAFFEDFTQAQKDVYGDRACALDAELPMCVYRQTDAEKAAAREARFAEVTAACAGGEAEGCYFAGAMASARILNVRMSFMCKDAARLCRWVPAFL
ncbi:MAG: SEL1-like repeat protein [Rhodobacteraceae bacterium]|nr:SEL1-like repeat protein [Paracoccaceae bacterium]